MWTLIVFGYHDDSYLKNLTKNKMLFMNHTVIHFNVWHQLKDVCLGTKGYYTLFVAENKFDF